jgi:hypothetical protein
MILMKTLSIICFALVTTVSAWAQQAVGNSQVNTDFGKYKSFTWAQKSDVIEVGPNGYDIYYYESEPVYKEEKKAKNKSAKRTKTPYVYSYSVIIPARDETANSVIQDAISNEMEGRGYAESSSGGDLIVSYQVLDQKAQLHGYNNDDPTVAGGQQVRTPQDTATFVLQPGSLIVSLIDAKTSQMVWNGFTRNLSENNAFITDEVKLKEAVHNIFQEFRYSSNDKARRN